MKGKQGSSDGRLFASGCRRRVCPMNETADTIISNPVVCSNALAQLNELAETRVA